MELQVTIGACAALAALAVFAGWRGAQPWNPARGPRLVPWRGIMVTAAAFLLLGLVHLANLMGMRTGR